MSQAWHRGSVLWASLDTGSGHEQAGRRPVVVVASNDYLETVTTLAIVVPVTTVDRGWPNHVPLRGPTGLRRPSWAMTEQPRTIDRARVRTVAGEVDAETEAAIDVYLRDFLALA
ncbi:type II toxin-antitoxin system PemK/MazF family toxin [Quadrisphaera sp. DSM 44207]|uniref:type II toxin-antitoxin system PemK/MazF family toxin n=1 Tax=Quadrisphaera sp. DSM 44207 TaxID=1881057 RepID=UPI00087FB8B6|nr:type II toxin-antitoxin system PemK/MazF family toxin [Quadrisphaera sp. DSM 44207]SDQ35452.1 mRNA interferase MazF [Quadrisphaera sp. DSM 44207]